MIAKTPKGSYYAVIFTSILNTPAKDYQTMANKMVELAQNQEGFLGIESAREEIGITVSYWKDENSIKKWKHKTEHVMAQKMGIEKWYKSYHVRVCKVERDYSKQS